MTTPVSNINRANLNALDPNLATGQVADPALRKACFDEIYNYFDTFVTSYNAFISGGIATANLADFAITTAKLALLSVTAAQIANGTITTTQIADGTLLDADVNPAAAIAWTKISKVSSSLADLTTRSAADLNSGTLSAAQMPALTGDITTLVGTIAATLKNTGTAGTYKSVTTDAQGRVIAGTNPTTLAGYGITDVSSGAEVNQNTFAIISVAGQSDVVADQKSDALTLVNGTGITITTNPTTDAITITATGSALPGAHAYTHVTGGTDVIANAVAGGNAGLMSGADKTQVNLITPHLADYTEHIPYAAAAGSVNAYTATLSPALASYTAGVALAVNINITNTGAATINVNSLGTKAIIDSKGNAMVAGKLTAGCIYTLRYNGTAFQLQGEGGGGTAIAADLLTGKTATVDSGDITGTMANKGANSFSPSTTSQTISAGFYNGSGVVNPVTGTAAVGDVTAGNTFSSANGISLTGTGASAKKYATGTITSSSGTLSFTSNLGAAVPAPYVTVTGLSFPQGIDTILVTIGNYDDTFYSSHQLANTSSYIFFSQGGTAKMLQMTNASVNTTGFILPVYTASTLYTWYAWGL